MATRNAERRRVRLRSSGSSQQYADSVILIPLVDLPTLRPRNLTSAPSSAPSSAASQQLLAGTDQGHLIAWAGFSPALISVWHYSIMLGVVLVLWVFYLILPKGLRKEFFGAYPKRHKKVTTSYRSLGQWIRQSHSIKSAGSVSESRADQLMAVARKRVIHVERTDSREDSSMPGRSLPYERQPSEPHRSYLSSHLSLNTPSAMKGKDKYYMGDDNSSSVFRSITDGESSSHLSSILGKVVPSPKHPSIERVPDNSILSETMSRLKGRGIRLIAHGVQCEPKKVWVKLDEDTFSLTWQTEFPRRVPNQLGEVSIVLMRGSMHRIALPNVLYIDVGKKTSALSKPENERVPDSFCFSLLTQNGSLDLQTNSTLERDALVSCFSMILDQVHEREWRLMYEEGSSVVASSANQIPSDYVDF